MAGRRQGGAQHFTVQEAQNTTLGQVGSMYNDGTSAMVAPTDHVFIAITFITDTIFDSTSGLVSIDDTLFINATTACKIDPYNPNCLSLKSSIPDLTPSNRISWFVLYAILLFFKN